MKLQEVKLHLEQIQKQMKVEQLHTKEEIQNIHIIMFMKLKVVMLKNLMIHLLQKEYMRNIELELSMK